MGRDHVGHTEIAKFAAERVNLPKDKADEYRAQARACEKLETYLSEHPDFTLRKMLLSGALQGHSAALTQRHRRRLLYQRGDAPRDISALLQYLAERLRKAFPNFSPDQVSPKTYSVTVSFRGTGLDVDVVPILYDGDPQWYGNLVSQDDGSFLKTSIPLHLEFAANRKKAQEIHFAQVVRLVKFWARRMKQENEGFRFKSFMIEMILAKLCDDGLDFSDYRGAAALLYLPGQERSSAAIVFTDYYPASSVSNFSDRVRSSIGQRAEQCLKLYTHQRGPDRRCRARCRRRH